MFLKNPVDAGFFYPITPMIINEISSSVEMII